MKSDEISNGNSANQKSSFEILAAAAAAADVVDTTCNTFGKHFHSSYLIETGKPLQLPQTFE